MGIFARWLELNMGMYTTLRFAAPLSADGLVIVTALHMARERYLEVYRRNAKLPFEEREEMPPEAWQAVKHLIPGSERFVKLGRSSFIPWGGVCGVCGGPEWEENRNDITDGQWVVCCSLKNYEGEIGVFMRDVLPHLIEVPCVAEAWYEEDLVPRPYKIYPKGSEVLVEALPLPPEPEEDHPWR